MTGVITRLTTALGSLCDQEDCITGATVVNKNGLVLAAFMDAEPVSKEQVGALGMALFARGNRVATDLTHGKPERIYLENENGGMVICRVQDKALLIATITSTQDVHAVFATMQETAALLAEILPDNV